jgi:hypothetical protein
MDCCRNNDAFTSTYSPVKTRGLDFPMSSTTIVTACDRQFVWGAFLLLLSLRRSGVRLPVHVMTHNLGEVDRALLHQIDGVTLFDAADSTSHRNIVYQKTAALLTADSDWVMWIDSDCLVTGDISPLIGSGEPGLQIRMRPEAEIAYLFKKRYRTEEKRGQLPERVLDIWRADVGQRREPAINTSCNAHCFSVHRDCLDFIRRWDAQIRKVIPDGGNTGVVDDRSFAYFLLDEAVMSSMLAFDENPPPVKRYVLEDDPARSVIHFGGRPKPWDQWLLRNLNFFDEITGLLDWAEEQGWTVPGRPCHLNARYKPMVYVRACFYEVPRRIRRAVSGLKKRRYN